MSAVANTYPIFYNFDVTNPIPLDKRFQIESLDVLHPINRRYSGLIFFVKSLNTYYTYLNDLNNPVPFFSIANSSSTLGLLVEGEDYSELVTVLNSTEPVIGKQVAVFPLGVTFVYDGTKWKYHSGEYNISNAGIFSTIANSLKSPNKLVNVGTNTIVKNVITKDLTLSSFVINLDDNTTLEDGRYYYKNNSTTNLYFCINNILYKIGDQEYLDTTLNVEIGENEITHNLKSTYVVIILRINNINHLITDYKVIDNNSITFESKLQLQNCTILIKS